jgi:hypothetical protein
MTELNRGNSMQSFSRGWEFLKQAWGMAFKDKDLLKPSIYALVVGAIVSVVGIIPIALAGLAFGGSSAGNVVMGVMGWIMVFIQFVVTYVFSGMTAYLIFGYLSEGDGRLDKAWDIVRRDFFDLLTLAAASTAVNLVKNAANRNRRRSGISSGMIRGAANLFSVLWTEASYLILPAMVIDDLNLKEGMQRVLNITKENLLLIGISTVGVRWVTGLIGFLFGFVGLVLAFAIGGGAVYLTGGFGAVTNISIVVGALIFFAFVVVASVISSYTSVAYHTCLYIWARDVEKAQVMAEQPIQVAAPTPLAAVLS